MRDITSACDPQCARLSDLSSRASLGYPSPPSAAILSPLDGRSSSGKKWTSRRGGEGEGEGWRERESTICKTQPLEISALLLLIRVFNFLRDIIPHASLARLARSLARSLVLPRATINISADVHSRLLLIACARVHVNSRSYKLQLRGAVCSKKLFIERTTQAARASTMRDKSIGHRASILSII